MTTLYLETSALLRILFDQAGSGDLVRRLTKADHVITSRLTRIEAERAIIRLSLDHPEVDRRRADVERDLRQLWARIDSLEMDAAVCELAGRLAPRSRLRTLDAIHLATYQLLRQRDASIEMLTCDKRIQDEVAG